MKVLLVGSGGREHALVWKLRQSPSVTKLFCAPGNPGIGKEAELVPIPADDQQRLLSFAIDRGIDLTVVGPEQPLADGIVDLFRKNNLRIFGPTRTASRLEWSKSFAKDFMRRHAIPTADYRVFRKDDSTGLEHYLAEAAYPLVLKADGLAAGKGVVICRSRDEAITGVRDFLDPNRLGKAGDLLIAEEFMSGQEVSVFAITDGRGYVTLAAAQDYKRVYDDDQGKNTGGMGAFAPSPVASTAMMQEIRQSVIEPTLRGMELEGNPYSGCLYVGLMITPGGPKVVEYNSRFGDPETQVVLPLLKGDLARLLFLSASSELSAWDDSATADPDESAVCVILASAGYPDQFAKGKEVNGLGYFANKTDMAVFHAGTSRTGDKIVTNGGRVLGVMAHGRGGLEMVTQRVYSGVAQVSFDGAHFRKDIGRMKSLSASGVHHG